MLVLILGILLKSVEMILDTADTSVSASQFTQKMNRTCNWNIRGGSTFANAGIAFVAVPTGTI